MSSQWNNPRLGRAQVIGVVVAVLVFALLDLLGGLQAGSADGPVIFVQAVPAAINVALCWAMLRAKPWARWLTIFRLGLGLLLSAPSLWELISQGSQAQSMTGIVIVSIGSLVIVVLLFGPGVGAFFAQDEKRIDAQAQSLDRVEGNWEEGNTDFDQLPEAQRVFRCVRDLESGLREGGLEEYYGGQQGNTAHAVVDALQRIGEKNLAWALGEANALFEGEHPPRDLAERRRAVEQWSWAKRTKMAGLENRLEDLDGLTPSLHAYLQKQGVGLDNGEEGIASS